MDARRRTKSQIVAEETRRNYLKTKNNVNFKDANVTNLKVNNDLTTNVTVVLNKGLTKDTSATLVEKVNLEKTNKLITDSDAFNHDVDIKQQSNNGTALTEVNLNFIIKKGKDNSIVLENPTIEKIEIK